MAVAAEHTLSPPDEPVDQIRLAQQRRREYLQEMIRETEALGLYDDDA